MDNKYTFYTPDGVIATEVYATSKEAEVYNIIPETMLTVAIDYFEAHPEDYRTAMEVYGKCYYTMTPGQEKR